MSSIQNLELLRAQPNCLKFGLFSTFTKSIELVAGRGKFDPSRRLSGVWLCAALEEPSQPQGFSHLAGSWVQAFGKSDFPQQFPHWHLHSHTHVALLRGIRAKFRVWKSHNTMLKVTQWSELVGKGGRMRSGESSDSHVHHQFWEISTAPCMFLGSAQ